MYMLLPIGCWVETYILALLFKATLNDLKTGLEQYANPQFWLF